VRGRLPARPRRADEPEGERSDRRRGAGQDRRQPAQDARPRVTISERLRYGWLAFESPAGRRRLAPIPTGWDDLPDDALARLCDAAVPITAASGRLLE
jgi:hypothetical protein